MLLIGHAVEIVLDRCNEMRTDHSNFEQLSLLLLKLEIKWWQCFDIPRMPLSQAKLIQAWSQAIKEHA